VPSTAPWVSGWRWRDVEEISSRSQAPHALTDLPQQFTGHQASRRLVTNGELAKGSKENPQFDRDQVGFAGDGTLALVGPAIVSMVTRNLLLAAAFGLQWSRFGGEPLIEQDQMTACALYFSRPLASPRERPSHRPGSRL